MNEEERIKKRRAVREALRKIHEEFGHDSGDFDSMPCYEDQEIHVDCPECEAELVECATQIAREKYKKPPCRQGAGNPVAKRTK